MSDSSTTSSEKSINPTTPGYIEKLAELVAELDMRVMDAECRLQELELVVHNRSTEHYKIPG